MNKPQRGNILIEKLKDTNPSLVGGEMNIMNYYISLMWNTMKNIFLNGLDDIAPTELNKSMIQTCYYDNAPPELQYVLES